jgi:hypothetical protein
VEDDQRRFARRPGGERGQVAPQVAADDARRVGSGDPERRAQQLEPGALPRPDQRL